MSASQVYPNKAIYFTFGHFRCTCLLPFLLRCFSCLLRHAWKWVNACVGNAEFVEDRCNETRTTIVVVWSEMTGAGQCVSSERREERLFQLPDYLNFLTTSRRIGEAGESLYVDPIRRFDQPLTCYRQTDRRTQSHSEHRAIMASRGDENRTMCRGTVDGAACHQNVASLKRRTV